MNKKIKTTEISSKGRNKKWATTAELKEEQDKIVKPQTYDLSFFIGRSYFVNDRAQLYLILQPFNILWKDYVMVKKWYEGDIKVNRLKKVLLLPLLIIVSLYQLNGTKIHISVEYFKKAA